MQGKKKKRIRIDVPVKKNEAYRVEITGITAEGNGVAKVEGFTVFVPGAAAGDVLQIKIVKVLTNYAFAIVEKIVTPSKDRVEVDCAVFRQCGGCCYRHISYEAELKIKEQQVKDCFERLGGIFASCEPIVGSEEVSSYRNKAQFPLGVDANGKTVAGFYAKHSHRIVPCTDCALQPPIFREILEAVLEQINAFHIPVYQEETEQGILRHVYMRIAGATGEIMLCLVSAKRKFSHQNELVRALAERFPQIKSIVLNYNPKKTNVILGEECITLYGADAITDILCGVKVQISPLSFYQVNKKQAERLYQQGIDYAAPKSDELLLDLYCGIGTIGLSAVERVKELIGVEIIPQAIENAKINARLNGFTNTRFLCGDCKTAVQELEAEGISPDIIMVDPPRKGCDEAVIETICRFAPEKLVMISCNPATAARDCKLLEERGYQVVSYRPFDLFPRTSAVECAVCLRRKNYTDSDIKKRSFFENAQLLSDTLGITPLMYGSLGLEYLTGENLNADDIDILIPKTFLTERWLEFKAVLEKNGYMLIDKHEHEFEKDGIHYAYAQIEELEPFTGIQMSEIATLNTGNIRFKLLSLQQYLKVYTASAKDGYRVKARGKKDAQKITFIEDCLKKEGGEAFLPKRITDECAVCLRKK